MIIQASSVNLIGKVNLVLLVLFIHVRKEEHLLLHSFVTNATIYCFTEAEVT